MTSQDMTHAQADELLTSAIRKYGEASVIYTEMATMATWTPEYETARARAEALQASAKADTTRFQQWKARWAEAARQNAEAVLADSARVVADVDAAMTAFEEEFGA